jgi:nickel-dependent lactate racemase
MPHFGFGFGGGAKMVLPGIAGLESILHNHRISEGTGPGSVSENVRRMDAEEGARMAGLDFVVNAILNADRDVSDLVCGDVVEAHRAGVEIGRTHYATKTVDNADISIGNGYPMANEGYKAYHISLESAKERVIVVSPHVMKTDEMYYGLGSIWVKSWTDALKLLEETYGREAEVALYPCAAMQISETNLIST